jgi:predicted dehydrogenase
MLRHSTGCDYKRRRFERNRMGHLTRIGIIGAGRPGAALARGCMEAGGFVVAAVADLIPQRRGQIMREFGATREFADGSELIEQTDIDAVCICAPNHLHASLARKALTAGKHVVCQTPPALNASEMKKTEAASKKSGKTVLFAFQRRFGGAEQAAAQAIAKGYAGDVSHARASWTRTRGIPEGTGWYTDPAKSGGGALIDIGIHMLDLGWRLLGQPAPASVFAATHHIFVKEDVEDSAFALVRFTGGKSLELASSWAINQPPQQQGIVCRVHGSKGAVDVYTPGGAVLHRAFSADGESKPTTLKPPGTVGYAALMRHFRQCLAGKSTPQIGAPEALVLMKMIDALYRSAESGRSVDVK